jgi:ethanolamine ammonia-lyase small subunit
LAEDPAALASTLRDWRALTPARIGLGRIGASLPTQALLAFTLDHAKARDAVHAPFAPASLADELSHLAHEVLIVASEATQRADYLRRPDLGRQLSQTSAAMLAARGAQPCDIAIMIGDGLSPAAVTESAVALVTALLPLLGPRSIGPIVVAEGARVALGDPIGALLKAQLVIMIIGERPGLTTPRSLGAYLTFAPKPGCTDADRNCVSNIHASGLPVVDAAAKIAWLARAALDRGLSGVALKDDSGMAQLPHP